MLNTTFLVLVSTPSPPHFSLAEQVVQEVQSVGGGSHGQVHASELQVRDSVNVSRLHDEEPQPLATSLVRRDFPPPQDSEQLLQAVHSAGVASRPQPENRGLESRYIEIYKIIHGARTYRTGLGIAMPGCFQRRTHLSFSLPECQNQNETCY